MTLSQSQTINSLEQFQQSLQQKTAPNTNDYLKSLWYVAKDNWTMAHLIARDLQDPFGY